MSQSQSEGLIDEIEQYYKLKRELKGKQDTAIRKVMSNQSLSRADKRERVKEILNACIRCKNPGGTIFEETSTYLSVMCGAPEKCDLQFVVQKGEPVVLLPDLMKIMRQKFEEEKTKMITLKIQHALGYISDEEAVAMFDYEKDVIKQMSTINASLEAKIIEITNNQEKDAEINRLKVELYNSVQDFKSSISEFMDTGKEGFIRDAMEKYSIELMPRAAAVREEIYSLNAVEINKDDMHTLLQERYTLSDLEIPFIKELREVIGQTLNINMEQEQEQERENRRGDVDVAANAGFL